MTIKPDEAQPEGEASAALSSSGVADEIAAATDFSARAQLPFPVVGIGASAGGLDALQEFFSALSSESGAAFVVVQHLPPDHQSLMAEILSRHTQMPVSQIEDGMSIAPNHVYVIRPGYTLTLEHGKLLLGDPVEKRGHRRPVDDLFRSLALEQREKAIAIILSGMGTNGTAGAQAIKAAGGLCIAQNPDTAEFPGMPQSLIRAGYADHILSPKEMPEVLLKYIHHPYVEADSKLGSDMDEDVLRQRQQLREILAILRTRTGHDFNGYKKPTLLRRMQRRMGLHELLRLADYAALLRKDSDEAAALANDLMINVTGFFRDPQAWDALRDSVIVPLVAAQEPGIPIRAWVTACASGEEPYSLAMLIVEEARRVGKQVEAKIFATDTADKSLSLARSGVYPGGIEGDLSNERLERFFDKDEHTYRIKKEIREMVVFAPQDLLRDPPFSRVDLCTCRNLLIYLEPETQERVLAMLHFALRDQRYLFLGNAETLGNAEDLFEVISKKWRIYRRIGAAHHPFTDLPRMPMRKLAEMVSERELPSPSSGRAALAHLAQRALLDQYSPPAVVVDRQDRVVYFHGNTTGFLSQPTGEPTRNLLELVQISLRSAVRSALRYVTSENKPVIVPSNFADATSESRRVFVRVAPLGPGSAAEYFLVGFEIQEEVPSPAASEPDALDPTSPRLLWNAAQQSELEDELTIIKRELRSTVEAFEANNEELKASNEEVISINEELQSANEELETGKEELQSLNEELTTVNSQLQAKITELESTNNDLSNLLSSTNIAVVFLDVDLRVRRYTAAMNDLLELIPADIGRPIMHLAQKFNDADLLEDARRVLNKLVPVEAEMRSFSGRWYLRRTLPYRTTDHRIDGIVITFVDISARKRAEEDIEAAQVRLQAVIEQMPAAVLIAEAPAGKLRLANRRAATLFGHSYPLPFVEADWVAAYVGFRGFNLEGRALQPEEWPLARSLASGEIVTDEEIGYLRPDGVRGTISVSSSPVRSAEGKIVSAVATFWDVSERKLVERTLRDSEQRFRVLIENAQDYAIFLLDIEGRVSNWNKGAERLLGWSESEVLGRACNIFFTPEDRGAGLPEQEAQQAFATGQASSDRKYMRKDGSAFFATGSLNAVHDEKDAVSGFVTIMRDNTARVQADERLREAIRTAESLREAAEAANRAKDAFISTVSHELRTPLNTIRLWTHLLDSGKVPEKDSKDGIQMIERAALAQQQLIDDLLDVSRMTSGKLRIARRDTRLLDAIKAAINAIAPVAERRTIKLDTTAVTDVGIVYVDPDRIQQVVANLLSNAVKFTPSGGSVRISLGKDSVGIKLRVADTGIGIRAKFLPHVFERFQQAETGLARQHSGLGLGLAIAKQLVELHQGTITVASEGEGHGATFTVHLPVSTSASESSDPAPTSLAPPRVKDLSGLSILLIEDEADTRDIMVRMLKSRGAQVQDVESAAAAYDLYKSDRPDVILSDIGLPGEDGYGLIHRVRQLEREQKSPRVPAIALTAFARVEDRQRALDAGFDEHVPKPVDTGRLLALLLRFRK